MGALRGRSLRHERGRKGRAHHDTDGDGGAVVGPRLPAGRGTLGASERAPFARPAQAWGVSRPPAHLSMPTPSVVPWARRTGPRPPPWLSSSFRSRARCGPWRPQGEACPQLAEGPPPWSHWRISAAVSGATIPADPRTPVRTASPSFLRSSHPSPPPLTPTMCWTPGAVPPPISQGQRLSVGLCSCGILHACGGSWGSCGLRRSAYWPVPVQFRSLRAVLLSWSAGCLWSKSASG
jgi:hypothetical protein